MHFTPNVIAKKFNLKRLIKFQGFNLCLSEPSSGPDRRHELRGCHLRVQQEGEAAHDQENVARAHRRRDKLGCESR